MLLSNNLLELAWTQCWQLTLLIVCILLIARLAGRRRPHLTHVLWLVVLAKCLTPPILASPGGIFCWLRAPVHLPQSHDGSPFGPAVPVIRARGSRGEAAQDASSTHSLAVRFGESSFGATADVSNLPPLESGSRGVPSLAIDGDPVLRAAEDRSAVAWLVPSGTVLRWGGWLWLIGSVALIGTTLLRTGWILRNLLRMPHLKRPDLETLLDNLSQRLGVRRRVRLVVTASRIGPAVVGLWRPAILLPEAIVDHKSANDLEPILVHELIHIRRGDLWTGLVQVLAQGVWWFHPLVWLANRRATRAAELCCDEAAVAELGCDPARYARSLLDVLELKRRLVSIPAFPGLRPVDVTRERLESLMHIEHGGRTKAPWWCWLVLVATAAITLPGGALVVAAGGTTEVLTKVYSVADLVVPVPDAKVRVSGAGEPSPRFEPAPPMKADFTPLLALIQECISPESWDAVGGGGAIRPFESTLSLVVRQTPERHDEIAQLLHELRRLQDIQVALSVSTIRFAPKSGVERLPIQWNEEGERFPYQLLSPKQLADLQDAVAGNKEAATFAAPKITVFNGQATELSLPLLRTAEDGHNPVLLLAPSVTANGAAVGLNLAVGVTTASDAIARNQRFVIKEGQTLLVDVTEERRALRAGGLHFAGSSIVRRRHEAAGGERVFILISAQAIDVAEVQE
ncbi:MAG: M56 family metallopeptidase [Planctomycetales bacterium]